MIDIGNRILTNNKMALNEVSLTAALHKCNSESGFRTIIISQGYPELLDIIRQFETIFNRYYPALYGVGYTVLQYYDHITIEFRNGSTIQLITTTTMARRCRGNLILYSKQIEEDNPLLEFYSYHLIDYYKNDLTFSTSTYAPIHNEYICEWIGEENDIGRKLCYSSSAGDLLDTTPSAELNKFLSEFKIIDKDCKI